MKDVFNTILRLLVKVALHIFYHKIHVYGKENIPKGRPIIFIANHQNALLDPLMIATHIDQKPHFLTRASAFKNPMVARMLDFIRMIPIYRFRDGLAAMKNNQETFNKGFEVLGNGGSIVMFPEGNHSLERRVRPLTKGFAKLAFGAREAYSAAVPVIVPVGLNYSAHQYSRSKVSIFFGEALDLENYDDQAINMLVADAQRALEKLTVHITTSLSPQEKESLKEHTDFQQPFILDQTDLDLDKVPRAKTRESYPRAFYRVLIAPLYLIWCYFKPKVQDPVFYGTFKFSIGLITFPLVYILALWLLPIQLYYLLLIHFIALLSFVSRPV